MTDEMSTVDIAIIGAGVIGLALAEALASPKLDVFVFEKHDSFGQETSSRNSEVIHAGIYYPPGSLKATLCVSGKEKLYAYLEKHSLPYNRIGKYIVANDETQAGTLKLLHKRAMQNGVCDLRLIEAGDLHAAEPAVKGVAALWSPSTGIFDTHAFMASLQSEAKQKGADILYNSEVITCEKSSSGYILTYLDPDGLPVSFVARVVINAAGLTADTMATHFGINTRSAGYALHYCKGEYFRVTREKAKLVSHLVYPVPDHASLGMHLTPDLGGGLRIGPNVTYSQSRTIDYTVHDSGCEAFLQSAQELLPMLEKKDVFADTAGYRPKLQGPEDDVKDFVIRHEIDKGLPGIINLIGIESPGLTASLAIAAHVKSLLNEWEATGKS